MIHNPSVSRLFRQQPDRIAKAWRSLQQARTRDQGLRSNLLDGLVEPLIQEIGQSLAGTPGSAWSRCRGLLRVSSARGPRALHEEFAALRRCLLEALTVLGGSSADRVAIESALDEAADSAVALAARLVDPRAEAPRVPFGGVVIEIFEPRPLRPTAALPHRRTPVH